jgi:flavorubredoxin
MDWELYLQLPPECMECQDLSQCAKKVPDCPVNGIRHFHRKIMPSTAALRYSLEQIGNIPFDIIAPQHGSIIKDKEFIRFIFEHLSALEQVGIDGVVDAEHEFDYSGFRKRFGEK